MKWYDEFLDHTTKTATMDLALFIDIEEKELKQHMVDGQFPEPDAIFALQLARRCLEAETKLGVVGPTIANATTATENAIKNVTNKITGFFKKGTQ